MLKKTKPKKSTYSKEYYQENKERIKKQNKKWYEKNYSPEKERDQNLIHRYNINIQEYDRMFTEQEGCCAICKMSQSKQARRFSVDHNHITNNVRGLLCDNCNMMLGNSKDNII